MSEKMPVTSGRKAWGRRWWPWALAGSAGLLVILIGASLIGMRYWDGTVGRTIRVRVADSHDGHPISGATVLVDVPPERELLKFLPPEGRTKLLQERKRIGTTDRHGEVAVIGNFPAGGKNFLFIRTGRFLIDGTIEVSHPDYRSSEGLIETYIGESELSIWTERFDVRAFLEPNPK